MSLRWQSSVIDFSPASYSRINRSFSSMTLLAFHGIDAPFSKRRPFTHSVRSPPGPICQPSARSVPVYAPLPTIKDQAHTAFATWQIEQFEKDPKRIELTVPAEPPDDRPLEPMMIGLAGTEIFAKWHVTKALPCRL